MTEAFFPLQAFEFHGLFGQVTAADVDDAPRFVAQLTHTGGHSTRKDFVALPHDAVAKGGFQLRQATLFQQCRIVGDLGNQSFLG